MFVSACVVSVRVIKTADFQKLRAHYFEYMKADNKNNMMSTVRQRKGIHEISVVADNPPPPQKKRASRVIQTSKSEGHSQVRTKSEKVDGPIKLPGPHKGGYAVYQRPTANRLLRSLQLKSKSSDGYSVSCSTIRKKTGGARTRGKDCGS